MRGVCRQHIDNGPLDVSMTRMRILHIINHLSIGGAQALVAELGTYSRHTRHQMEVCTIYSKGQFAEHLELHGTAIHNLNLDSSMRAYRPRRKYDLRMVLPLARLIRRGQYDVVHAHLFPASLFVALASYLANEPRYVLSEHSVTNRRRRHALFKLLDSFIYRRFSQIIAVSEMVRESLLGWLPGLSDMVQVVPNSVDPERFVVRESQVRQLRQQLGINDIDTIVLYAGRLLPAKGPDVLLEALSRLPVNGMPIKVLIAGDGPLEESLRKQVAVSSLERQVAFLGLRKDIALLLNLADLVVLPSRWEGLPMILLEAMAARRPIIAAKVGGVPEVVQHGLNGWLVPPEDPIALAKGMDVLIKSPGLRRRLGDNAFQTVCMRYSVKVAFDRLLEIYRAP